MSATALAIGASMTCTGSYTTTAADVTAGSVTNTATATGTPAAGSLPNATAQATITRTAQPSWTLTKTPNPATYSEAGQTITYRYVLRNTGNVSISSISIADNRISGVECPATTLAVGVSMTCSGTYTTTAADVTARSVVDTATATGTPAGGTLPNATAQATITLQAQPSWTLTKTPSPATYSAAGQIINYTYRLINTGNVAISAVSIADNRIASVNCPSTSLAVGASLTCTGRYTITAADVAAPRVQNTARATGTPTAGTLPAATAQATINRIVVTSGSITIVKSAAGGNDSFSFTSTVAGATSFALTTVGGSATRTFSNLAPGAYTFSEVNLPANWNLTSLNCTGDGSSGVPTSVNLAARSVTVGLDSGEAITCTFANTFNSTPHRTTTTTVINRFLAHRVQLLANHDPDRSQLLRRLPGSLWGDEDDDPDATANASTRGARGFARPGASAAGESPFTFTGGNTAISSRMSFATSTSRIAQAHTDAAAKDDLSRLMAFAGPNAAQRRPTPVSSLDFWVEAHFSEFQADLRTLGNRGHFGVVYLGADYLVSRSVLVGALVQFDWLGEKSRSAGTGADGRGVMAGPYISARIANNVFFDARAAWGSSWNNVNPFGLYTDGFTTDRWLAHAKLTGNWRFGNLRFTPSAAVTYVEEKQQAYTDSVGIAIPSQTVALGRFAAGPEVAYRIVASNGAIYEPHVGLKAVWDFKKPDAGVINGLIVSDDEFHVAVEAGMLVRSKNGVSVRAVVAYDGVGSNSFRDVGGQLWISVPLN